MGRVCGGRGSQDRKRVPSGGVVKAKVFCRVGSVWLSIRKQSQPPRVGGSQRLWCAPSRKGGAGLIGGSRMVEEEMKGLDAS